MGANMVCSLSVYDANGAQKASWAFATFDTLEGFLEYRIRPLIAEGAEHIVVVDSQSHRLRKFSARAVCSCILAAVDWWSNAGCEIEQVLL